MLFATLALGAAAVVRGPAQWWEAERSFARALAIADAIGSRSARALALIGRGRLAQMRSQHSEARADLSTARDICAGIGIARYERMAAEFLARSAGTERVRASAALEATSVAR